MPENRRRKPRDLAWAVCIATISLVKGRKSCKGITPKVLNTAQAFE
jgi:hypothetical protein